MTPYTRKNAWNNGGTFTNTDLLWYAKAVQVMQSRPISDPVSWWFYSAIHGEFLIHPITNPAYNYLNWVNIAYIPATANLKSLPSTSLTNLFWAQCQHGSWFFPPWHRGYLVALENILRDIIVNQLDGPADWALPYWNYMNQSTENAENNIPPAFLSPTLPDGTSNPLYVPERFGPNGDGKIFVQVGLDPQNDATDECQWDTVFNNGSTQPSPPGPGNMSGFFYGGPVTGFAHAARTHGDLESNPHDFVHGMVGGQSNSNNQMGLMGVPDTAALDPVFYLHHANIDRMWKAWNDTGKNPNTTDPNWLKGPSAQGNSRFAMPLNSQGAPWYYTPKDVLDTANLKYQGTVYSYTYDDLSLTSYDNTPPAPAAKSLTRRLAKFGIESTEKDIQMPDKNIQQLVGASPTSISLNSGLTHATVKLAAPVLKSVSRSMLEASPTNLPDEVFLQLENVQGANDANFLSVFVNEKFLKTVSLFGLLSASREDSHDGGSGLTFNFNISDIIDELHLSNDLDVNSLNVQIKTKNPIPEGSEITVGRISVYRQGQ